MGKSRQPKQALFLCYSFQPCAQNAPVEQKNRPNDCIPGPEDPPQIPIGISYQYGVFPQ